MKTFKQWLEEAADKVYCNIVKETEKAKLVKYKDKQVLDQIRSFKGGFVNSSVLEKASDIKLI